MLGGTAKGIRARIVQGKVRQRKLQWLFCFVNSLLLLSFTALHCVNAQSPQSPIAQPATQPTSPVSNQLPSTFNPSSPILRQQSLPGAARTSPAPAQLTLSDAINLAVANNLATLLANEQRRAASGFGVPPADRAHRVRARAHCWLRGSAGPHVLPQDRSGPTPWCG